MASIKFLRLSIGIIFTIYNRKSLVKWLPLLSVASSITAAQQHINRLHHHGDISIGLPCHRGDAVSPW